MSNVREIASISRISKFEFFQMCFARRFREGAMRKTHEKTPHFYLQEFLKEPDVPPPSARATGI